MAVTDRSTALTAYRAAVAEGRSTLVRPPTVYDGLDVVVAHLARRSGPPLVVTDLTGPPRPVASLAPREGETRCDEPLLGFHTSGST